MLTKKGRYWHYDFIYRGKRYQGSTDQTNINKARLAAAAVRSNVALETFGIAPPKPFLTFKEFLEERFQPFVKQNNAKKPRTIVFYSQKVRQFLKYEPFLKARLNEIDEDMIARYKQVRAKEKTPPYAVGYINSEVRVLRRALGLAAEWRLIPRLPKIRIIPGEKGREFVLTGEMETAYLAKTDYPLKQAAILMLDLGLRPSECVSLQKTQVTDGYVTILDGKSENAARSLPQTERTTEAIALCYSLFPASKWLFPGRKGHLSVGALDFAHRVIRDAEDSGFPPEFVLYACRHTKATRLAESGANAFEIKSIMGHSSIVVSQKYIHIQADTLGLAMKRSEAYGKMLRGELHEETSHPAVEASDSTNTF